DDLGERGDLLHMAENLHPIIGGHPEIGQHEIIGPLPYVVKGLVTVRGFRYFVARFAQHRSERRAKILLVIYDQDYGHQPTPNWPMQTNPCAYYPVSNMLGKSRLPGRGFGGPL